MPIVRFWRRRKASAPSLMAFEIACMAEVPWSFLRTQDARYPATKSDPTENVRIRGRAISKDIRRTPVFSGFRTRRARPGRISEPTRRRRTRGPHPGAGDFARLLDGDRLQDDADVGGAGAAAEVHDLRHFAVRRLVV